VLHLDTTDTPLILPADCKLMAVQSYGASCFNTTTQRFRRVYVGGEDGGCEVFPELPDWVPRNVSKEVAETDGCLQQVQFQFSQWFIDQNNIPPRWNCVHKKRQYQVDLHNMECVKDKFQK